MEEVYDPHERPYERYLKFWGTRGSIPVSGTAYATYGGNTVCLELRRADHTIIIDGGTGIRILGEQLIESDIRTVHLFFGHTHWDHIIGLPFFHPLYEAEFDIHIYTLEETIQDVKGALTRVFSPEYFPVRYEDIHANLHFHEISLTHPTEIDGTTIAVTNCDHPGGALAFKITTPKRTVGYVTDNEFLQGYLGNPADITPDHPRLQPYQHQIDLLRDVDILIHEAQYTPQAYRNKIGWGHSSITNATILAKLCNATNWVVTHHDPIADDDDLHHRLRLHWTICEEIGLDCNVTFAYDGLMLTH